MSGASFLSENKRPIIVAAGITFAVALIGASSTNVGPWYHSLRKSRLNPPDWVFPVAWTTLYVMIAAAGVLAWRRASSGAQRRAVLWLFLANAALNVLWSVLFFGARRPDWAMGEIVPFLLSTAALVFVSYPLSQTAGLLLVPYLLWVAFAGYLNWAVVQLNGPFGKA